MGHIFYPAAADFGRTKNNATGSSGVGYTVYDKNGNVLTPRSTSGVVQVSPGIYSISELTFPGSAASHEFFHIVWDTGASFPKTYYASETLLPSPTLEVAESILDVVTSLSSSLDAGITQGLDSITAEIGNLTASLGPNISQNINDLSSSLDRKSTRLNSSHVSESRMPSSA